MKRILLLSAFMFSIAFASKTNAQVSFSLNIGSQPVWGPTGYDHVEYYYLPDIDAYYYVPRRQFIYQERGRWIFASSLPARYRNYDLYSGYKVVVNDRDPYRRNQIYRQRYASYRGRHDQVIIRNSRDERYYVVPGHPQHNTWVQRHGTRPVPQAQINHHRRDVQVHQRVQTQQRVIHNKNQVIKHQRQVIRKERKDDRHGR